MAVVKLADSVFSVGCKDPSRRVFDALISLPNGTTYNSYLVVGSAKAALVDTVNPGFEQALLANVSQVMPLEKLDFVVMNHAEPDHANAIPFVLEKARNAKLVTSKVGAQAAKDYYCVPEERILVVDESSAIDLGGKTLKFVDAPWLHWPETMFTFLLEDRILFPCDFFGQHLATDKVFEDEVGWEFFHDHSKRYFGEIMMPFRKPGQAAVAKVKALGVKMIAPSHGLVCRRPEKVLAEYEKWTAGALEKKVLLLYVSMWGSCKKMALEMQGRLSEKGVECNSYDLASVDLGEVARELVDSACIVVSAPTVLGAIHPVAAHAANVAKLLRPPTKYAAVISSFGWHACAASTLAAMLSGTQIEVVGAVEAKARPKEGDLEKVRALSDTIAEKVLAI